MSAFGQHQKFPPHARKTSDIQGSRLLSYQQEILLLLLQCMRFPQGNPTNQYPPLSNFIIMLSIERRISRHTTSSPGLFTLKMGALFKGKALGTRLHVTLLSVVAKFLDLNNLSWQRRHLHWRSMEEKYGLPFSSWVQWCTQENHTRQFFRFFCHFCRTTVFWDPEILVPWQRDVTTSSLYSKMQKIENRK